MSYEKHSDEKYILISFKVIRRHYDHTNKYDFKTNQKMKPLSAPIVYLTRASLYPWYLAGVYAPTLFLLHQLPLNPHLKKEGKREIASMFKTEP